MTKVIILGENTPEKPKKPIEFVKCLNDKLNITDIVAPSNKFNNIELICANYNNWFDLMFAYDDNRNDGCLYLGHFNDGVVE